MNILRTLRACLLLVPAVACQHTPAFFPAHRAVDVNPDTRLELLFDQPPVLGTSGMIRIHDVQSGRVVDSLDLSIPPGPTQPAQGPKAPYAWESYRYERSKRLTNRDVEPGTPSGCAKRDTNRYQLTIIGGFTDGFHFYPVMVEGNKAIIQLHHDMLEYGKTYYVTMDPGVLTVPDGRFQGVTPRQWRFTTKAHAPQWREAYASITGPVVVVNANGTGDFSTVQGALDFVPDMSPSPYTVYVENGDYRELVYFRNKSHLRIVGQSRDSVLIHYPNNEVFNPHPADVSNNEWPGTFPYRRAAFAADNCTHLYMSNLTVQTDCKGQAEGLFIMGSRNHLHHIRIVGDGDALQANGSLYVEDCEIDGGGDAILGRGPGFFTGCVFKNNGGPFMWIRNTSANHGNVFVNCTFRGNAAGGSVLARAPKNGAMFYPFAEAVLIDCILEGIPDIGWGPVGGDTKDVHYWEFNSTHPDGRPIDVSHRAAPSRQLDAQKDSLLMQQYRDPSFVLDGWAPDTTTP